MIAVKIGTVSWRRAASLASGEVEYTGPAPAYAADGLTSLMVWDAGLGNMRPMTQTEVNALPAQLAAAKVAAAKAAAAAIFTNAATLDDLRLAMYAFKQLVLDDRNQMADKLNAIGTALAANPGASAAATLATIRAAVLAIPGGLAPKYTQQQLDDAIVAKINATGQ